MKWFLKLCVFGFVGSLSCQQAIGSEEGVISKKSASEVHKVLSMEWVGPHGGVPPFDQVKVSEFKPTLEAEMTNSLARIDKIAANSAPPSFENTIAAMELADEPLERVNAIYGVWASTMASDEFRLVQAEMEPKLAAFYDKITQNAALFKRIETIYNSNEKTLTAEQRRLAWDYYTSFVRAGAKLSPEQKKRVAEINQRLATLYTKFSNNLLHDEESYVLYLTKDQLGGLPQSFVGAAAAAAKQQGHDGKYAILNTRSSMDPFLTYSTERSLREKVWRTYYSRGDNGDAYDNNAIITEILKLRAERTQLQGLQNVCRAGVGEAGCQDSRCGHGFDDESVARRRRASEGRGRGHAGDRGQGKDQYQDRDLGLSLLRRKGSAGKVRFRFK